MEDFIATVRNPHLRELLEVAIMGRGAFRRFKDVLYNYPTRRSAGSRSGTSGCSNASASGLKSMTLSQSMTEERVMTDEKPVTLEAAIHQVIDELDGLTPVAEVVRRVLAIHPSAANGRSSRCAITSAGTGTRPGCIWMPRRSFPCMRPCTASGSASFCPPGAQARRAAARAELPWLRTASCAPGRPDAAGRRRSAFARPPYHCQDQNQIILW